MESIRYYPIMLNIKDKLCIVIGGGKVAYRKIQGFLECGARVKVISPEVDESIMCLIGEKTNMLMGNKGSISDENGNIEIVKRNYRYGDLKGATIVIAATNYEEVNKEVRSEAKVLGIPVNVVDDPDNCDFILPSVVRRGDLLINISTNGKSPAFAKKVREMLENEFDESYAVLVDILHEVRQWAINNIQDREKRKEFLNSLTDGYESILSDIRKGEDKNTIMERLKAI